MRGSLNVAVKTKNIDTPGIGASEMYFCPVCSIKALAESIGCKTHMEGGAKVMVKKRGKSRKSAIKRFMAFHNNSRKQTLFLFFSPHTSVVHHVYVTECELPGVVKSHS